MLGIWKYILKLLRVHHDKYGTIVEPGDIIEIGPTFINSEGTTLCVKRSGRKLVIYDPCCCKICEESIGYMCDLDMIEPDDFWISGNLRTAKPLYYSIKEAYHKRRHEQ